MERRARPHHFSGDEAPIEGRIVGGGEREAVPGVDQFGQQHRKGFPGIALPQPRRRAASIACQGLRYGRMSLGEARRCVR